MIHLAQLLRWNKPSGRLILLIPAGWSLWLSPNAPPSNHLLLLIILGGVLTSGAGCIANDIWDKNFDSKVQRTKERPLAKGIVSIKTALALLFVFIFLSLLVVLSLPIVSRKVCLILAIIALPIILLYPSAKRWFEYPQFILAFCWGFSVLIPWAAIQGNLNGGIPLLCCWLATICWTFGFDTIYAMSDREDDINLGLKSSAISLGTKSLKIVSASYAIACFSLAIGSAISGVEWFYWLLWSLVSFGMQREVWILKSSNNQGKDYGNHFRNQVLLGALLMFGLVSAKIN